MEIVQWASGSEERGPLESNVIHGAIRIAVGINFLWRRQRPSSWKLTRMGTDRQGSGEDKPEKQKKQLVFKLD